MDETTERGSTSLKLVEHVGENGQSETNRGHPVGAWRRKLSTRAERLRYLETAERYWYGKEYGSEKRKKPA